MVCTYPQQDTVPTALERVQVLLQPEEYAELSMLAKDERRKLSGMAAVLIVEAIEARKKEGRFTPSADDPAYANALERQQERLNRGKEDQSTAELMKEMGGVEVVRKRKSRSASLSS